MKLRYLKLQKRNNGFTLIELLVVITIIITLSGFLMAVGSSAKKQAKIAKAKAMIASLETALGMFKADMGGYPDKDSGYVTSTNLVTALTTKAGKYIVGTSSLNVADNSAWSGPYISFKQGDIVSGNVVDPWGHSYAYNVNPGWEHGTSGQPDYMDNRKYLDIWSAGPDGDYWTDGDIISNWTR